ncbi:MAG: hypothetical protein DI597_13460 [Pseudoxanthomonas spadix]|nr:MAG: hypothetical protein DI597_13460 [Pseudoxanthomonas spadix]
MTPSDVAPGRSRGRWILLGLFVLFFGSVGAAGVLRFAGWQPAGLKNHGQLLQPAVDVRALQPALAGGGTYTWRQPQRTWRIVLAPPADCVTDCVALSHQLDTVWQLFGHNADQVHILWIGPPPAGAARPASLRVLAADTPLRAALPGVDDRAGVPVYVIDPNGFVIQRFAPGFDPADLRSDVAKLLKLL